MKRRNVLLGLGTAAAGSGILFGSGAFTQVEAERDLTIGIDSDSEALLALRANKDVASVYEDDSTGELVIDTDELSDKDEGFNVGATVQIGATEESFGDTVEEGDEAFKLVNNFDDQGEGDFDPELNVAIDLTDFDPDEDTGTLEFVATADDESQTVSSGESRVFEDVESGEKILVAIRIETDSPGEDPDDLEGEVVFQAGSDLSDDDFPAEQEFVGEGEVLNQDQDERFDGDDPITEAVSEAESNETLIVGPGTYDESVSIGTEGLTLESAEEGAATIEGQVTIEAPNVEVSGFTVTNPEGDTLGSAPTEATGIRATGDASGVLIQDNVVTDINTDGDEDFARGIIVAGLDDGDSADGLEIRNNTVSNVEGSDADDRQVIAIQILEESNGDGLIENVVVDGNTIEDVSDTRSAQGINFNGNIEGKITNNDISELNTDGPAGTGFTQAIPLNAGGNAASAPQNVEISGNVISDLETEGTENFAPASHLILNYEEDTIEVSDNDFTAVSTDEVFVSDNVGDLDLDAIEQNNEFDPDGSVVGDTIVPSETITVGDEGDFDEIQPAVGDATDGDVIEVAEGTYEESVDINVEGLTLEAADGAEPTVEFTQDEISSGGEAAVVVDANDATIEGFTIDLNDIDGEVPSGIHLNGDNTSAVGNTVTLEDEEAPSGQTFIAGAGDSVTIDDNTLDNAIVSYGGDGDATLTNNDFSGEVIDEAIWSTTSGELTVTGNDLSDVDTDANHSDTEDVKFTEDGVTVNGENDNEDIANSVKNENDGVDSVEVGGNVFND